MKILSLTLKKKWFEMIKSGYKKEEYREIKDYWKSRFLDADGNFKHFDVIEFKNGYKKDSPKFYIEIKSIEIKKGNPNWGALKDKKYFVLSLGKTIHIKNDFKN